MPTKRYRNFGTSPIIKKDKPLKPNRKSSFRMLASAKKYECKEFTEYMLLRWENEYILN